MSTSPLLLRALRGEPLPRPPVWAMRQAGRWDPLFRQRRGGRSFYDFVSDSRLAAEVSLLPARFGVDAIILFYDITTLAQAMGVGFEMRVESGPMPIVPVVSEGQVRKLDGEPDAEKFRCVLDTLALVRSALAESQANAAATRLPILVFAGAPFTLASYCIGTGKDVAATCRFAAEHPGVFDLLLDKLESATIHFVRTLLRQGADAWQLFDSWAGRLSPEEYQRWALPYHQRIFRAVGEAPGILFVKECPYPDWLVRSGAAAVSLGTRHDLAALRQQYPQVVFQGNVDARLLADGTPAQVIRATQQCIRAGGKCRHIVNLNHGVEPHTPVENFAAFIATVSGAEV
ncbi:MAG: uroporphyrinogen decarboxylase family protein [Gemmatales bacterium]|nr:uroporphyrinogen decarboxylase family protein [Gemmatales bacterium]MCS7161351.1 uroporphyrinogen decarboxylase family protein [Gemmatales bacterium]MDW8176554.1 uroporphyrinogen decarboxylase family protein [Gemmatales bacterium]MDW8222049.1 uroporphyrinogen decarboxylase family protein [Gemmatales bacterium]